MLYGYIMNQHDPSSPQHNLTQRIQKAQEKQQTKKQKHDTPSHALGYALRMGLEMASALLVGLGLGYAIDYWLQTQPIFMIILGFFGIGAGISNIYRVVTQQGLQVGYQPKDDKDTSSFS